MGRVMSLFFLFLLSLAMSCEYQQGTNEHPDLAKSVSGLVAQKNGIVYPISSMTFWDNANYGACGAKYKPGTCHTGTDILVPSGTPVYAVAAGEVILVNGRITTTETGGVSCPSGWGYDYGVTNTCNVAVFVRHYDADHNPFIAVYGHVRRNSVPQKGDHVAVGQQIGVIAGYYYPSGAPVSGVGGSGDHLHWGIAPGFNMPPDPWGTTPCSVASYDANVVLPEGCSAGGFTPPGTFMSTHFPQAQLFSHYDTPTVCASAPDHDASWFWTCPEKRVFQEKETAWVLFRLYDVQVDHWFRVKAHKNGVHQWDWTLESPNDVGEGGWQYSHFWPTLINATAGKWRFDLYLLPKYGTETVENADEFFIDSAEFTVSTPTEVHTSLFQEGDDYEYDGNGYTCPGPIVGDASTNWFYSCGTPRALFEQGEDVYGLIRIDNVMEPFRFSVDVYKDGVYQWYYTTQWSDPGEWGWDKTYFWAIVDNAQPGNWEFRVYVDEGDGFDFIDDIDFVVTPYANDYEYSGSLTTCTGPVTGGAGTNWVYTCENPTSYFTTGQSAIAHVRIDNVYADHRWKEEVYIDGVYQWDYVTQWFDVGEWGWEKTYFSPVTSSVWPGDWEYRIYVDTGSGFQYIDSAYFIVE